ncbi:MAG TPA: ATP-dependent helicase [Humibacter sp.]|nr:ATP-dependent helicase [Humibacter sp.]
MTDSAERLLDGLDEQQRSAAETLLGPVRVLAGAGTGKTRAITHRIAYGVASGVYAPNRVMALTFTARAASELRSRLRHLGAGPVVARTFHSAALSQLSYFWPLTVGGTAPRVLDGKARVLGQAAERLRIKVDTATLRDIAAEIEWRKVSAMSIEDYAKALQRPPGWTGPTRETPGKLTAEQAIDLHRTYETLKDERKQIDFEDVLLVTAGMIEAEPSVAMHVHEQYRFFVVDEYQDVSPLQQNLLDLWLGERRDLCVVGDASQTIYSFAGASSSFLLDFGSRYPDAALIRLEQNYRSSVPIVDTANRLMRGRPGSLTLHAVTQATPAPGITSDIPAISAHATDLAEARAVATDIRSAIDRGAAPESMAILYRINVQAAALENALNEVDVSYQIRGAKRFFDLPEVKQAVLTLRGASVSVMGEPLFKSVSDVLRSLGWTEQAPQARGAVRDRWEALNAIMGLADQAVPGTTFRRFTDELLERQAAQHEPTLSAVTLATVHSAKGLEWDAVYLIGLSEGLLPISYATNFDQVDEERRLFYVGITRARRRLWLSWARRVAQRSGEVEPSRFLAELGSRSPGVAGVRVR